LYSLCPANTSKYLFFIAGIVVLESKERSTAQMISTTSRLFIVQWYRRTLE